MGAATLESKDVYDAIEMYFEKGWTDGLPVVPPRPEVVKEFIATVGRDPEEVLITFNETNMQCTVELAAVNAVMAGCRPEYFPVVLAAVECWNDPRWGSTNVYIGTASTGGAGQMVIVNGPIRNELKLNSGVGLFGPGFRANATIGRAVRLILMNALGMQPQVFDMSIMGHPGKYTYCIAEAEEDSPWEPYHVERGFKPEESTVTILPGKGPVPVDERSSDFPEGILNAVATVMLDPVYVDFVRRVAELARGHPGGHPAVVMGDLNTGETAPVLGAFLEHGFVDAFRATNPTAAGPTVWQRIDAPAPTVFRRVDYVFLRAGGAGVAERLLRFPDRDGRILALRSGRVWTFDSLDGPVRIAGVSGVAHRGHLLEHGQDVRGRPAVQRARERADGGGERRSAVGTRRGDDPGRERRRVEPVLGRADPVRVDRLDMARVGLAPPP